MFSKHQSSNVYHLKLLCHQFQVESGVDELIFNLIILGSIVDSDGKVWQARNTQYYVIESMPFKSQVSAHTLPCMQPGTLRGK